MKIKSVSYITFFILSIGLFLSCDDNKTYAELLEQEENAINKFLDGYQIADIPDDGKSFITTGGKWDDTSAPFYKLDEGVYMQVVATGDMDDKAKEGEEIQIIADRTGLLTMSALSSINGSFRYGYSSPYLYFGYGVEKPLKYLGVNSKVRLIVPSKQGTQSEATAVQPILWDITYRESIQ